MNFSVFQRIFASYSVMLQTDDELKEDASVAQIMELHRAKLAYDHFYNDLVKREYFV